MKQVYDTELTANSGLEHTSHLCNNSCTNDGSAISDSSSLSINATVIQATNSRVVAQVIRPMHKAVYKLGILYECPSRIEARKHRYGKQNAKHLFSFREYPNSLTHSRWSEQVKIDSVVYSGICGRDGRRAYAG